MQNGILCIKMAVYCINILEETDIASWLPTGHKGRDFRDDCTVYIIYPIVKLTIFRLSLKPHSL